MDKNIKAFTADIFKKGFEKSSKSFSNLSGEKVGIKKFELSLGKANDLMEKIFKNKNLYVLITDVIGEAKGKSYLVLNHNDAEEITGMLIRKMKNIENNDFYKEAILKEVDNVLAASVITELSNELDLKIFGDVPKFIKPEEANQEWLRSELELMNGTIAIYSSANFFFEANLKISPSFIWILDSDFNKAINQKSKEYAT
ncbi:hypothetical protein GCM10011506_11560 [Marivirga lumbricoides]|uniref:Chemotaxis phosphatase CheX-like domain-containing protein n=1 Tax=Marivirga lumbricoides TaxID=1046115 RepID=A0ABQ1LRP7_9BACT|nr:hypothetical protein GCM10011506_11560 [Marivirga lumbricoides]